MRAAIYKTTGPAAEVLKIEELPTPQPGAGEVRVKLAFSGANPSDVKSRSGASNRGWNFPVTIPHSDGAGAIDAVGAGVDSALAGRRVWVYNGQWERAFGTAAEYIALPAAQAVPLPDGVSFEAGASIGIPLMTAFHAVAACGSLVGRTVIVAGAAGSVGNYATQLARIAGARVIALISSAAKAEIARAAGAHEVVNYREEDVAARIKTLTGGCGASCIIDLDAAGNGKHYGAWLEFGGKAVIYGSNAKDVAVPFGPMITNFVTMYFFIVYRLPQQQMHETLAGVTQLLEAGLLKHPEPAIYALGDIAAAHQRVEAGANAKVLIRF
jgi:NADPH2:quinone reductase